MERTVSSATGRKTSTKPLTGRRRFVFQNKHFFKFQQVINTQTLSYETNIYIFDHFSSDCTCGTFFYCYVCCCTEWNPYQCCLTKSFPTSQEKRLLTGGVSGWVNRGEHFAFNILIPTNLYKLNLFIIWYWRIIINWLDSSSSKRSINSDWLDYDLQIQLTNSTTSSNCAARFNITK